MLWLEMSRDPVHGGGDWEFGQCLWSPSHKKGNAAGAWPFWDNLRRVREADVVLHLRGKDAKVAFVGTSTADGDGFETHERPPMPGQWTFARSFKRVDLKDFTPFLDSIPLRPLFAERSSEFRSYFQRNSNRVKPNKRSLFYVVQAGKLQCLNGAYLSEVDDELASMILGPDFELDAKTPRPTHISVITGEQIRQVAARVGQQSFSTAVKANYGNRCCFPGCALDDARFLVGAHIARSSDAPRMRGDVSNGLCFCLVHDTCPIQGSEK